MGEYICYCLIHTTPTVRTYVGCTNNPVRRIRQHNREIKGGARYTGHRDGGWRYHVQVHGFDSQRQALSFEWHWKHRSGRRVQGRRGTPLERRENAAKTLIATDLRFQGLTFVGMAPEPPV